MLSNTSTLLQKEAKLRKLVTFQVDLDDLILVSSGS